MARRLKKSDWRWILAIGWDHHGTAARTPTCGPSVWLLALPPAWWLGSKGKYPKKELGGSCYQLLWSDLGIIQHHFLYILSFKVIRIHWPGLRRETDSTSLGESSKFCRNVWDWKYEHSHFGKIQPGTVSPLPFYLHHISAEQIWKIGQVLSTTQPNVNIPTSPLLQNHICALWKL